MAYYTTYRPAATINDLFERHLIKGNVLGVGDSAKESALLNIPYLRNSTQTTCTGINLDKKGVGKFKHFEVIKGDAHNMPFEEKHFSAVICYMMLEHDSEFWLTIEEIRRVLAPNGLLVVGVPGFIKGYTEQLNDKVSIKEGTVCYRVHDKEPLFGDYYRFSATSLKKAIFKGFKDIKVDAYGDPPRLIGHGFKAGF